jgi:hypothetical protein
MTRTFNKPAIYSIAICGSALVWQLIWVIGFGSPVFVLQHFTGVMARMEDSNFWLNIFGMLIPFSILALAVVFARKERVFRPEHPFKFWAAILMALSPGVCAVAAFYLVMHTT